MNCIIDASLNEKYYTLGLWGKPVIYYPIHAALENRLFKKVYVSTSNEYVIYLVKKYFSDVFIGNPDAAVFLDGRAALITGSAIAGLGESLTAGVNVLDLIEDEEQCIIVNSSLMFELALVVLHNRERETWQRKEVLERIEEKRKVFSVPKTAKKTICLIGHSQLDQWDVDVLGGYRVKNCGISGITTKEYLEDIIGKNLLNFDDDVYLVLMGINDYQQHEQEVADNIVALINTFFERAKNKPIFFVEPLLVNGRLDRNNSWVMRLRDRLKKQGLCEKVFWIHTDEMNDPYGNLNFDYTIDGIHLSSIGYQKLKQIVEEGIKEYFGICSA